MHTALLVSNLAQDTQQLAPQLERASGLHVSVSPSFESAVTSAVGSAQALVLCAEAFDPATFDPASVIAEARARLGTIKIVVVGWLPAGAAFNAARAGADAFMPRPTTGDHLAAAIMGGDWRRAGGALPSLARAEWEYLQAMLAFCGGNRSEAARRLGIHRSVLQRKLCRLPPLW